MSLKLFSSQKAEPERQRRAIRKPGASASKAERVAPGYDKREEIKA
jgi:hypothetical protein